MEVKTVRNSN